MLIHTIDASLIRRCFLAGAKMLDANKDEVNELNVFPVPDGDTGTNMTMTIMSAASEVSALPEDPDMKTLCKAISGGSLKGARGNSGVILSQLLRGFTKGIQDVKEVDAETLQAAFDRAVSQAYKAVMKPKEGTILTVARAGSEKALEMVETTDNLVEIVNAVLLHMEDVLEQTPDMLPVLKQAGVVDSGGQGLLYFLHGCYQVLLGKEVDIEIDSSAGTGKAQAGAGEMTGSMRADRDAVADAEIRFGYCTEFIIMLDQEFTYDMEKDFKSYLTSIGDSIVCVADDDVVKVHVHTNDPGLAIQRALTYGQLTRMKIDNMREEHNERVIRDAERLAAEQKAQEEAAEPPVPEKLPHKENAFISVSAGEGISDIFRDLGVDIIIEGGQTMNPSTEDILMAIERIDADHIFILPNNGNILLAANQAKSMAKDQDVIVIQSKNIPQGVAAMLGFIDGVSSEENEASMNESLKGIIEGEVTYAIRDTQVDGKDIKKGDIMGITGKKIEVVGSDVVDTTTELIRKMLTEESELVTLYYGEDASEDDAARIAAKIGLERLDVEFEIQPGGQPIYYYFISVE
ncbi:MAG: DAK2 domain-containing protein [Eubacterium sp.]|nr:DAK2 domain-containing protein [Eubacterium sp.]